MIFCVAQLIVGECYLLLLFTWTDFTMLVLCFLVCEWFPAAFVCKMGRHSGVFGSVISGPGLVLDHSECLPSLLMFQAYWKQLFLAYQEVCDYLCLSVFQAWWYLSLAQKVSSYDISLSTHYQHLFLALQEVSVCLTWWLFKSANNSHPWLSSWCVSTLSFRVSSMLIMLVLALQFVCSYYSLLDFGLAANLWLLVCE